MTSNITTEEFLSLSHQDRKFYLENKDEMEMVVINGKLHFKVYNNKPYVTWPRYQELLALADNLTDEEREILHIYHDFTDWNKYGRPYADYGFHYYLDIDISSYSLKKLGINKPAKEWLVDWLLGHGFSPEETQTVIYTGGITGYTKEEGHYNYKSYGIEVRCKFNTIPHHYLPNKVHKWLKRNPEWKDVVLKPEHKEAERKEQNND